MHGYGTTAHIQRVLGTAFLETLGIAPAIGRDFRPDEHSPAQPAVLINDRLWPRRFNADRSFFADPQQTGDADIDLIDQCQIPVPLGVLDFIDAYGVHLAEHSMLQTPR